MKHIDIIFLSKNKCWEYNWIKYLLKDKGLTIKVVKNVLNTKINKLDHYNSYSLKADYYKNNLKNKTIKILDKLKRIKKNGKKNTY